jgi:anti-anti-sigma factor
MITEPWTNPEALPEQRIVVRVAAEIDLQTAPGFRQAVDDVPDTVHTLVIDLREVTFMACAGLPVLLAARGRFGARLLLRGPSASVTRLLVAVGLDGDLVLQSAAEPWAGIGVQCSGSDHRRWLTGGGGG